MSQRRTRRQKKQAELYVEEPDSYTEPKKTQAKKQKAPTNKERFQSIEDQMAGLTAAIGRLTAAHSNAPPPTLAAPASLSGDYDPDRTLPHLSSASTPKPTSTVRRDLIHSFEQPQCDSSVLAEPILNNGALLNDDRAKRHVDNVARAAAARMPRSAGKPVFDVFLNKVVAYEMPRHFLDIHSQRRIKTLDSYDDLILPEFLQGYIAMLSKIRPDELRYQAMVRWLGSMGQALVDYQWTDIRDWMNSVLHEVGQGRLSWLDEAVIADRLSTAKLQASVKAGGDDPVIPVCAQFNQGKCSHDSVYGVFKHICALCWVSQGLQFSHPAHSCRRRNGNGNQPNNRFQSRDASHTNQASPQQHYSRQHGTQGRDRRNVDAASHPNDNQVGSFSKN